MDDINVQVQDKPFIKTNIINNIKISVNRLLLFKSVSIYVNLLENNKLIENKYYELTGDEYTAWGNDDNYIINYVLDKLDMTPASVKVTV
jgi:hypothetical protein